jgi:hypothetical protein
MTRVIRTLIVLVAVCALAAPVAHANYKSVIRDCAQDGKLDRKYSDGDLIKAKKKLPSDLNEYSDCSDVIAAAIGGAGKHGGGGGGGATGGGGGAGGGGNAAPASPAPGDPAAQQDRNDLNKIVQAGGAKPKVRVGDRTVAPGKNGLFSTASAEQGLPLPLLLTLIAMAVVALCGGFYALRKRIPALAKIPLPRISLPRRVSFSRNRR